MVKLLRKLVNVPSTDPDDARRRRLLNLLVASTAVVDIAGLLLTRLYEHLEIGQDPYRLYTAGIVMLVGLLLIFLINHYWSRPVAAVTFLLLFLVVLNFDYPDEIIHGRTLFLFVIPILMSSVVLRSYTSLVMALIVNIVMVAVAVRAGRPPNAIALLAYVLIGLISWLAARSLEHALRDVRAVNRELDRQNAERQRLAGEIHDTLAQGFTSIVMQLEAAEPHLPAGNTTVQHHFEQARYIARDCLIEARQFMRALQPGQQAPISEAIQRVANRWSKQTGIPTTTTITGQIKRLNPEIEVALLRATQEALANIRKHASARCVNITLSYMSDVVMLDIQDDGRGFTFLKQSAALPSAAGGYGLNAMRERVCQLGGSLEVESIPGEGTTVVVQFPL